MTEKSNTPDGKQRIEPNEVLGRHADFDTTPVEVDGAVILSQDLRDEQERAGYVPDVQPKAVPLGNVGLEGGGHSAPNGYGAMQPTGNVVVNSAVTAAQNPKDDPVAVNIKTQVEAAKGDDSK